MAPPIKLDSKGFSTAQIISRVGFFEFQNITAKSNTKARQKITKNIIIPPTQKN